MAEESKDTEIMNEKLSDTIGTICTVLGGALLLYPLIHQATKTLAPEIQRLTSGGGTQKLLQAEPEHHEHEKHKEQPIQPIQPERSEQLEHKEPEHHIEPEQEDC